MADSRVDNEFKLKELPRTSPLRLRLGAEVVVTPPTQPSIGGTGRFSRWLGQIQRDFQALTWAFRKDSPAPFTLCSPQADTRLTEVPFPEPSTRSMRVTHINRDAEDAATIELTPVDGKPVSFNAGQFITLFTDHGEGPQRRAYSLCTDASNQETATIAVRKVPGGRVSEYLVTQLELGAELTISGPSGQFGLDNSEPMPERLLLVGAGSGLSPLLSIAATALAQSDKASVACVVGNRSEARIMLNNELSALQLRYPNRLRVFHTLSSPTKSWTGRKGRIDSDLIEEALIVLKSPKGKKVESFICGPAAMMELASKSLKSAGLSSEQIHSEAFTPTPRISSEQAQLFEAQALTIRADGQQFECRVEAGETLLEAALRSGAPMPYSCSVGGCGACRVSLTSGSVSTPEPNCLTEHERQRGCTLTCIARPLTHVSLEIQS